MRTVLFVVVALLGCGNGKDSETVAKYEAFSDEICACKDKACAVKAETAMHDFAVDLAMKSSEAEIERIVERLEAIEETAMKCYTKLVGQKPDR